MKVSSRTVVAGARLKDWDHDPGPHVPTLLARANALRGAGRNWSRSEQTRRLGTKPPDPTLADETARLAIRFHSGKVDASELPSSYTPAATGADQIDRFGLAEVVDHIDPHGTIMAGMQPRFAPKGKGPR